MTYSVIAFDPESGAYGVGVQSHWFNVASSVPWVQYRVGVVATQGRTANWYGWSGLEIMSNGVAADSALASLVEGDENADRRQVGMVDANGNVAIHTGQNCIRFASHVIGDSWGVLGNLLTSPDVVESMAEAFDSATGPLAERMVSTLEAAETAGGDLRGKQSAAVSVVPGERDLSLGYEMGVDISVADHNDPVSELRRLVEVDRAYRALRRGQHASEQGDRTAALEYLAEVSSMKHGVEVDFWRAIGLATVGEKAEAIRIMESVVKHQSAFRAVLKRVGENDPVAAELDRMVD